MGEGPITNTDPTDEWLDSVLKNEAPASTFGQHSSALISGSLNDNLPSLLVEDTRSLSSLPAPREHLFEDTSRNQLRPLKEGVRDYALLVEVGGMRTAQELMEYCEPTISCGGEEMTGFGEEVEEHLKADSKMDGSYSLQEEKGFESLCSLNEATVESSAGSLNSEGKYGFLEHGPKIFAGEPLAEMDVAGNQLEVSEELEDGGVIDAKPPSLENPISTPSDLAYDPFTAPNTTSTDLSISSDFSSLNTLLRLTSTTIQRDNFSSESDSKTREDSAMPPIYSSPSDTSLMNPSTSLIFGKTAPPLQDSTKTRSMIPIIIRYLPKRWTEQKLRRGLETHFSSLKLTSYFPITLKKSSSGNQLAFTDIETEKSAKEIISTLNQTKLGGVHKLTVDVVRTDLFPSQTEASTNSKQGARPPNGKGNEPRSILRTDSEPGSSSSTIFESGRPSNQASKPSTCSVVRSAPVCDVRIHICGLPLSWSPRKENDLIQKAKLQDLFEPYVHRKLTFDIRRSSTTGRLMVFTNISPMEARNVFGFVHNSVLEGSRIQVDRAIPSPSAPAETSASKPANFPLKSDDRWAKSSSAFLDQVPQASSKLRSSKSTNFLPPEPTSILSLSPGTPPRGNAKLETSHDISLKKDSELKKIEAASFPSSSQSISLPIIDPTILASMLTLTAPINSPPTPLFSRQVHLHLTFNHLTPLEAHEALDTSSPFVDDPVLQDAYEMFLKMQMGDSRDVYLGVIESWFDVGCRNEEFARIAASEE